MFSVKEIVRRGFFGDKVLLAATSDATHSRKRLGFDHVGAPEVWFEAIRVTRGEELLVSLPKGAVAVGQIISPEQVADWPAFERYWITVEE